MGPHPVALAAVVHNLGVEEVGVEDGAGDHPVREDRAPVAESITLEPASCRTLMTLTDPEVWGEALAWLRGYVDFSVELRGRRY